MARRRCIGRTLPCSSWLSEDASSSLQRGPQAKRLFDSAQRRGRGVAALRLASSGDRPAGALLGALGLGLVALGVGAALTRTEYLFAPGRLTVRRTGMRAKHETLAVTGFAVRHDTDSDGDSHFELFALASGDERSLLRAGSDPDDAVVLGRRLSSETGAPLALAPEAEP